MLESRMFITKEEFQGLTEGDEISEVAGVRGRVSKRKIVVIGF